MFFVNKYVFFTTKRTKICFATVIHVVSHHIEYMWEALHLTNKMYLLRDFYIVVLSGVHEFAAHSDLAANLPTALELNWAAASQHCGIIEQNTHFLKEKIRSLHHSLPSKIVRGILVVRMLLHTIKFVNEFLC